MKNCLRNPIPEPASHLKGWPWHIMWEAPFDQDSLKKDWPKISIVTVNYNYAAYLEKAIRSALLQGYPNLEYIIIDDGSTDHSWDIINKYSSLLAHGEVIAHQGQTRALNYGMERCTGEIIHWLCSDDYLLPQALFHIGKAFKENQEADVVVGRCQRVFLNKKRDPWIGNPTLTSIRRIPVNHAFSQSACFFRKELLDRTPFLDIGFDYAMDLELWAYFQTKKVRWEIIEPVLSVYQIHSHNKTTVGKDLITREFEKIYCRYVKERIALPFLHRKIRYPLERFLARHESRFWFVVVVPLWLMLSLLLMVFYGFDKVWFMRWKRWAE